LVLLVGLVVSRAVNGIRKLDNPIRPFTYLI